MAGTGALRAAGTAANTRVGWSLGNNKFMQWIGNRGVESLAGLGVGVVTVSTKVITLPVLLKNLSPKLTTLFLTV